MLYVFAGVLIIVALILGVIAHKKISECKTEEERRIVKAKWKLICALFGVAACIMLIVLIFTTFF